MTLYELETKLRADATARGSVFGQIWHEADVDGHHLYMADTSFGDGPIFRFDQYGWNRPQDEWIPYTVTADTADDSHLKQAMACAEKADWTYRLEKLEGTR